ncbi:MAG: dephospho-CoA kinase [Actinobacteria bacterium]|nr:dephospho-CoA kinase [Actinomycetota bacterium]MCS5672320.1 dephospho-CoA kinase [Acidimicrobiales bacterium]|tara:strand:+ start:118 stop:765 length:648 start_codon:yes stop_codon:yes gene_type:complete
MLEIGLTGGIGSGKSTVAAMLVDRGASLLDADAIVRDLQTPGTPVFTAMVQRWGDRILDDDGWLDRQAVADIVFADADELAALNGIVHPAVGDEMTRRREALADTDATVILDIPLLVESGHQGLAGVIVVDVDPEVAVARLVAGRGFTPDDARSRIARQASREERLGRADLVVDNGGSLEDLTREVDRAWSWIGTLERPQSGSGVPQIGSRAEDG